MRLRLVESRRGFQLRDLAVETGANKTFPAQLFDDVAEFALLFMDDRGEYLDGRAFLCGQDAINHLLHRPAAQGLAGYGMMGLPQMSKEEAQEVVDFRGGGNRGAGIAPGGALLDGDGGRKALDEIDVGLFHLLQVLPRVGGETFDVAALALGVERIEGERRFAGAADAGEDDELVARQRERDVLEIVLACPADPDFLHGHNPTSYHGLGELPKDWGYFLDRINKIYRIRDIDASPKRSS